LGVANISHILYKCAIIIKGNLLSLDFCLGASRKNVTGTGWVVAETIGTERVTSVPTSAIADDIIVDNNG